MDLRARGGVFVSYSHRDGIWLKKLRLHLGSLACERGFHVDYWDDSATPSTGCCRPRPSSPVAAAPVRLQAGHPHQRVDPDKRRKNGQSEGALKGLLAALAVRGHAECGRPDIKES